MHFTHLKYTGQWLGTGCPTPQALEELDQRQFKSLNGDAGGTWNPTRPIVIGGAGFTSVTPLVFSAIASITTDAGSTLTFPGPVALFGATTVAGATTFQSGSTLRWQAGSQGTVATGSTWTWNSGSTLQLLGSCLGTLEFQSGFVGTMQSGATLTLQGTTSVGGTLAHTVDTWTFTGTPVTFADGSLVTRSAPETISGTAAITSWRHGGSLEDRDYILDASYDTYTVPPPSADRQVVLLHQGQFGSVPAFNGMRVRFACMASFTTSGTKTVTFKREDGSTIAVTPAAYPWWIEFEFRAAEWHCFGWGNQTGVSTIDSVS